jgi:spore coat protein U-like protein
MFRPLRRTGTVLLVALLATGTATVARAASITASVNANVVKPLVFTSKQNLDFGTVLLGAAGTSTVSLSMAGVLSCGSGLTCSGATRPAIFNVQGSNGQVVRITAVASDLTNAADGSTLRFTPIAPASVTLTNSGAPGKDFNLGGSIAIPSTTTDGTYTGNVVVTAEYQ